MGQETRLDHPHIFRRRTSTVATLLTGVSSMEMLSVECVERRRVVEDFDTKPTEFRGRTML